MSLTVGDVVVGTVGPARRQGLALVGPSVNIGSRLLKHILPGQIIATGEILDALRIERPDLAAMFSVCDREFLVPGADGLAVSTYASFGIGAAGEQLGATEDRVHGAAARVDRATPPLRDTFGGPKAA